jgi:hypothetical protein
VKRIAIAGILTECNDFTSALITEDDFERVELLRGLQMLERTDGVVGGDSVSWLSILILSQYLYFLHQQFPEERLLTNALTNSMTR